MQKATQGFGDFVHRERGGAFSVTQVRDRDFLCIDNRNLFWDRILSERDGIDFLEGRFCTERRYLN